MAYYPNDNDPYSLGDNSIYCLLVDSGGDMWIGSAGGVYRYDFAADSFRRLDTETAFGVTAGARVTALSEGPQGRIWIGTHGQGIFAYDKDTDLLEQFNHHSSIVSLLGVSPDGTVTAAMETGEVVQLGPDGELIGTVFRDPATGKTGGIASVFTERDTVWYGMEDGELYLSAAATGEEPRYVADNGRLSGMRSIFPYSATELMLGTENGIVMLDKNTGALTFNSSVGTIRQTVNDIYRDREGGLWIATEYGGVYYIPRRLKIFEHYLAAGTDEGEAIVNCFAEDSCGDIWVGTRDAGLLVFDGRTGRQIDPPVKLPVPLKDIRCIMIEDGTAWLGTFSDGLYIVDLASGTFDHHIYRRGTLNTLSDNSISAIYLTSDGIVYVGTRWGLHRYNPLRRNFTAEARTDNQPHISDILEDGMGNIWFSSYSRGIYRFFPEEQMWMIVSHMPGREYGLPNNKVICMMEDSRGRVWISTERGLCYYDYETGRIERIDADHTMPGNLVVYAMEEDDDGYIWTSGNNGLECIDPDNLRVVNRFTKTDGLQGNQFNHRASFRSSTGKLFFGGINGFNTFYPSGFRVNDYAPPTVITNFYIDNREVRISRKDNKTPLKGNIAGTDRIKLKNSQNSIAFDFAALSYQDPSRNRYMYRLSGWDDEWIETGTHNRATYNNLSSGRYRFMVRGSNNDGVWSADDASVTVEVLPPFYKTWWAYLFYSVLVLGAMWGGAKQQKKLNLKRLREYTIEQEKRSYLSKINFFTNLAHEIRTPLTLIKVPLENILNYGQVDLRSRNYLRIMESNTANLLNLVNQLLDFRKSEEDGYRMDVREHDVSGIVQEVCDRFRPVMQINGISLTLEEPDTPAVFNVDREAVLKIVNNLLSNASKYARSRVTVSVESTDGLVISVSDDGLGIPEQDRSKIFHTFYTAEGSVAGTGLGLPLAQLLTEKHSGSISVGANEAGDAVFTVSIPKLPPVVSPPADTGTAEEVGHSAIVPDLTELATPENKKTVVLVVEDNNDMRWMIADIVGNYFTVLTAQNGKRALEKLDREDIHIIVSDLMMPEMDGYQLCEFVKSDMRYSHIPVIQLTAKTTIEDRIKGLEYGADAYIDKPFSAEHLLKQIANLIGNRKRLMEGFRQSILTPTTAVAGSSRKDNEFILKVNAYIAENLQNTDFYIDSLAEKLYMSRSSFYRKIKNLFGMSPNEYLKSIRLTKARELLLEGELLASEIYLMVGFSSLSYFSTCFKNHFGMSPKDYVAEYRKEKNGPAVGKG